MERPFSDGDTVLLKDAHGTMLVRVQEDMVPLGRGRGAISRDRIVGRMPGDRLMVGSRELVMLRPDILDILENLERGAQIILPRDSAFITMFLGLSSGCTVIEGGAGSGGLTLALLNSVAPTGRVRTYEVRKEHLDLTMANVKMAGLEGLWEPRVGDVRKDPDDRSVDAFVLDIPDPESAVMTASSCLRTGGRFCAFVPTMNQVERTVSALDLAGFTEPKAFENIQRQLSVKTGAVRPSTDMLGHTGYIILARWFGLP